MNIVCATDNAYVPWCGVMLTSLRENHASTSIAVYILTEGLSDDNRRDLLSLENENFHIHICQVVAESLKNLPIKEGDHVSLATYYRLYLPDILPAEVNRIIYLDCDMVVVGDLSELMTVDCGECGIAAVRDEASHTSLPYERLSYDYKLGYFNAGLLVIDLDVWRGKGYQQLLIDYITAKPDRCKFHDQDALNGVFAGKWKELPLEYNLQTGFIIKSIFDMLPNKQDITDAIKQTRIVHYTGPNKPWSPDSKHPLRNKFLDYCSNIYIPAPSSRNRTVKEMVYALLCNLGIKKRYSTYIDVHGK